MSKKYDPKARETIEQTMDQFKKGKLKSGPSNKKVTNRKQSAAIGISGTRDKGHKAPDDAS